MIAGDSQPPEVHAIAAALNSRLGNIGKTVDYIDAVEVEYPSAGQTESLRSLVADIKANSVDVLIMIGGNPVYDAPVDLDFGRVLEDFSKKLGKTTRSTPASITMKRRSTASGICRWRTSWKSGATPVLTTARRRSCNR